MTAVLVPPPRQFSDFKGHCSERFSPQGQVPPSVVADAVCCFYYVKPHVQRSRRADPRQVGYHDVGVRVFGAAGCSPKESVHALRHIRCVSPADMRGCNRFCGNRTRFYNSDVGVNTNDGVKAVKKRPHVSVPQPAHVAVAGVMSAAREWTEWPRGATARLKLCGDNREPRVRNLQLLGVVVALRDQDRCCLWDMPCNHRNPPCDVVGLSKQAGNCQTKDCAARVSHCLCKSLNVNVPQGPILTHTD